MNKAYKQLKKDNRADKGKELASQGKGITNIRVRRKITNAALSMIGSMAWKAARNMYNKGADAKAINAVAAIMANDVKAYNDIKNLRAYYAH